MPTRDARQYTVYRNGLLALDMQVKSIRDSVGASRLDTAILTYPALSLEGRDFYTDGAITCTEIEIYDATALEVVHWGKVAMVTPVLNSSAGEELVVVSRADKFLLGGRVEKIYVWDPELAEAVAVDRPLVFNPLIDGRVYGNLNDTQATMFPLLLDPDSVRTAAAKTYQGADVTMCPLSAAVFYLLQTLNAAQTYIANPTLLALETAFDDAQDVIADVKIPVGTYLADALDLLLNPMGYNWRIKRTAIGARTFEFFRQTAGALRWVHHQAMGDSLRIGEQNVISAGMQFDAASLANEVTVLGGPQTYEVTVELARAWAAADDVIDLEYLHKESETFTTYSDVWRKWVLNEAGDYIGLRTEIDGLFTSQVRIDFTALGILDQFPAMRRKFLPTLTQGPDLAPIGTIRGIEVEYYDPTEEVWLPIGNWGCQVLDKECGIYLAGTEVPWELYSLGSDARIRVTCSLESDIRVSATGAKGTTSPQVEVVPIVLDVPTKFGYRAVTTLSKYYGSGKPADTVDNLSAIYSFATYVRDIWDLLDVGGSITLEGLDATDLGVPYDLGQRVQGILGKLVSFKAKLNTEHYPQIVAIDRNVTEQSIVLHLQRYTDPVNLFGNRRDTRLGRHV